MTVNELIVVLMDLQKKGRGDYLVGTSAFDSLDISAEKVDTDREIVAAHVEGNLVVLEQGEVL